MHKNPRKVLEAIKLIFPKELLFKYNLIKLLGAFAYAILAFRIYTTKFLLDSMVDKDLGGFYFAIAFIVFVYGFGYFLRAIEMKMHRRLALRLCCISREFLFDKLVKYPYSFFASNLSGKLVADLRNFDLIEAWYDKYQGQKIEILSILIILGIAFYTNFYLGVSFIVFSFLILWLYKNQVKKISDFSEINTQNRSIFIGRLFDYISNISLVRLFNTFKVETFRTKKDLKNYMDSSIDLYVQKHKFNLYGNFLLIFLEVLVTFYLIYILKLGQITVGDFTIIIMYLNIFNTKFLMFIRNESMMSDWKGGIESACKRLFVDVDTCDPMKSVSKPETSDISLDNLTLKLSNKKILKNLSLEIKEGEKIGLVGLSGAGKTTLVETLMRLHCPDSKMVYVGGKDITKLKLDDLLDMFGIVDQNTLLYNDTIEYNLTLGRKFSDKQIKNALQKAYLNDFIKDQDKGLKTMVGERGVKLSGGQKQRIGIARAILFDAPILILDEATASLDSKSEEVIQKSIKNLIKNKTVIAIAHRLSTLDIMDRILVMKNGRIIEDGSQKDLLNEKGAYYDLYTNQNDKFY